MIRPMALHGGIDLGGTKIQAAIVDSEHEVLGSARRPTPTTGGPADVAAEMATALRDAARRREHRAGGARGRRCRLAGHDRRRQRRRARAICPAGKGTFPLAGTLEGALGCEVRVGNDVQVATDAEFKLGAGRLYDSLLGVFWGTGVGGGLILDGEAWIGRGRRRRDRAHGRQDGRRALHLRATRMRGGLRRPGGDGSHVRKLHDEKGTQTDLFKLMKEHERTRLTSGIWARALEHGDKLATEVDRPRDRGARRGHRLGRQPARRRGGRSSAAASACASAIPTRNASTTAMQPHLFADCRPPHVHVAALGDLGGAIGASLLVE